MRGRVTDNSAGRSWILQTTGNAPSDIIVDKVRLSDADSQQPEA